jgi:hypothetical protein
VGDTVEAVMACRCAVQARGMVEKKHSREIIFLIRRVDGSERTRGSEWRSPINPLDALTRALA